MDVLFVTDSRERADDEPLVQSGSYLRRYSYLSGSYLPVHLITPATSDRRSRYNCQLAHQLHFALAVDLDHTRIIPAPLINRQKSSPAQFTQREIYLYLTGRSVRLARAERCAPNKLLSSYVRYTSLAGELSLSCARPVADR